MAKAGKSGVGVSVRLVHVKKKTSQGNKNSSLSTSMMNKSQRANHKRYRGQGK